MRPRHPSASILLTAALTLPMWLSACDKSGEGTSAPDPAALATAQIKEGAHEYKEHCGGCHGDAGKGSEGVPAVIGADSFPTEPAPSAKTRTAQFNTASDLHTFIAEDMPPGDDAGTLPEEETLAITAWLLNVNGWKRNEVLTTENASAVQLSR